VTALPREVTEASARGWRLFPVEVSGKLPLVKGWPEAATSDIAQLEVWAHLFPACNWGTATGTASGLVVIDVDGAEGRESLAALERQGLTLPATLTVTTGRTNGGEHRYYRLPSGVDIRNDQSGKIGAHVDVRGTGGFVVYPPSIHTSGKQYRFIDPSVPVVDLPSWVIERLTVRSPMPSTTPQASPQTVKKGSRTNTLVSAAGTMRRRGMSAEAISAALVEKNRAKCSPPLSESKVRSIAADISKRYPAGGPDILQAAVEAIEGGTYRSHTDRFHDLCMALQRLRGQEPVVLPVERIAGAFSCHWTLIARLRRQAVIDGWLIQARRAFAHRQAASFRVVLSDTPALSHYKENEAVGEGDTQLSDTQLSDTQLRETPGFSETRTPPLDASIFSLEKAPSLKPATADEGKDDAK